MGGEEEGEREGEREEEREGGFAHSHVDENEGLRTAASKRTGLAI